MVLLEERAWLDRLLQRDLAAQRRRHEPSAEEFQGLWVSDDMVAAALAGDASSVEDGNVPCPVSAELMAIARRFGLTDLECCLFVLAAAAEVDTKYESIFAYLNGIASRRWPTVGLALRLFGRRGAVFEALAPHGRLMGLGLVQPVRPEAPRPEIAAEFRAARAAIHVLNGITPALPLDARWIAPSTDDMGPLAAVADILGSASGVTVVLGGEPGGGQLAAAAALAKHLGRGLLRVDIHCGNPDHHGPLREALLVARLTGALTLLVVAVESGTERPLPDGGLARLIAESGQNMLLSAGPGVVAARLAPPERTHYVPFPAPAPAQRENAWRRSLDAHGITVEEDVAGQLAARFRLGPEDIGHAAAAARLAATVADGGTVRREHLFAAARRLSGQDLARLAQRVEPTGRLDDLVLPPQAGARVQALFDAVCHFDIVHREWGLSRDGRAAGGIAALFQGPSGTGKTMTAGVIAAEAGLDLYRIDLSGVVSKYIGETEKNLDAIFRSARRSSAILMFDEADALFGKRAEVKDAHDRYANIEVAYLLQRIEDHDGPVVLSTNLARNIDQAFARRLAYIIEFPRPDAAARGLLWQRMLRPPVPAAGDVDCVALGRAFELTGGEIRKAALEAAYMAAADGRLVRMRHLTASAAREARRQGRMVDAALWSGSAEVA